MPQLENIEAIEKRLWNAADTLRANSNYASNEYFLPVMGLIFLRHAYSRYLAVKDEIEANLPTRGGKTHLLTKEDFSQKSSIFLRQKAQFDHLVSLTDRDDRARAIVDAMESIEADYESLRGALPKNEYQELDNVVLGQLLRTLNPEELKKASGDIFGRIYEYFLTQFAPFGLPGVNKSGKVSNGNYLWISYFYSYLNPTGRAGHVMSSQASSAGRDEAKVRQKLIETGDVDIMIAIRSNFFYTRTVPCELWFLNRNKPEGQRHKVLMFDARNIYHKVTRKIYDFSPEQLQNILAIIWLYRGQSERFLDLVARYLEQTINEANGCFEINGDDVEMIHPLVDYQTALAGLQKTMQPFLDSLPDKTVVSEVLQQLIQESKTFEADVDAFRVAIQKETQQWQKQTLDNEALKKAVERLAPLAETSHNLVKQADLPYKLACRLIDICENELAAKESDLWVSREIVRTRKTSDEARQVAVEQLKRVRYFHRQAAWLTERFPDAVLRDVEGLVKLGDRVEIAANDWSLTPGRYVGVAPEEEDDGFDFEEALRDIHIELEGLNAEVGELAAKIKKNFEELGI